MRNERIMSFTLWPIMHRFGAMKPKQLGRGVTKAATVIWQATILTAGFWYPHMSSWPPPGHSRCAVVVAQPGVKYLTACVPSTLSSSWWILCLRVHVNPALPDHNRSHYENHRADSGVLIHRDSTRGVVFLDTLRGPGSATLV